MKFGQTLKASTFARRPALTRARYIGSQEGDQARRRFPSSAREVGRDARRRVRRPGPLRSLARSGSTARRVSRCTRQSNKVRRVPPRVTQDARAGTELGATLAQMKSRCARQKKFDKATAPSDGEAARCCSPGAAWLAARARRRAHRGCRRARAPRGRASDLDSRGRDAAVARGDRDANGEARALAPRRERGLLRRQICSNAGAAATRCTGRTRRVRARVLRAVRAQGARRATGCLLYGEGAAPATLAAVEGVGCSARARARSRRLPGRCPSRARRRRATKSLADGSRASRATPRPATESRGLLGRRRRRPRVSIETRTSRAPSSATSSFHGGGLGGWPLRAARGGRRGRPAAHRTWPRPALRAAARRRDRLMFDP